MTEIKLHTLRMENFKGCKGRMVDFGGENASIIGSNGTGKTTHYDALCWLLFGKDSADSAQFEIMPQVDGEVVHGVMPTVEAVISVNGEEIKLRREYAEVWSRPRGAAEEVLTGHETRSYVDDVLKLDREYKAYVAGIVDEKLFRLLTGVYAFTGMKDADRRALLFEMCGLLSDADLMARDERFEVLAQKIGRRSVEDYKALLRSDRRKLNTQLDELPVRIDECSKAIETNSGEDFSRIQGELDVLEGRYTALVADKAKHDNNSAAVELRAECTELRAEMKALEAENDAHRQSQVTFVYDPRPDWKDELGRAERRIAGLKAASESMKASDVQAEMRLDKYRKRWLEIQKESFHGGTCPTCGQLLPAEQLSMAKARFEADKKRRQDDAVADSNSIKEEISLHRQFISEQEEEIRTLDAEANELRERIKNFVPPEAPVIEDLLDYESRKQALSQALRDAEARLMAQEEDTYKATEAIRQEIETVRGQIRAAQAKLAVRDQLTAAQARMEEFRVQQRALGNQLSEVDGLIFACEQFVRYKAEQVTAAINAKFSRITFRLFDQQINGGLRDCCDVLWDGKPYSTCSAGEQIKAGLDAIEGLSAHYGVRVPLFLDGAESVTDCPVIGTQMIRLVVSENYTEDVHYEFKN